MSPFLSDILFTLAIGALVAPSVGVFVFDQQKDMERAVRIKQSVMVGAALFFVPTFFYLASYLFFSVLYR